MDSEKKINKKEVLDRMMKEPELTEERVWKLFKEYLNHYPNPDMFKGTKDE